MKGLIGQRCRLSLMKAASVCNLNYHVSLSIMLGLLDALKQGSDLNTVCDAEVAGHPTNVISPNQRWVRRGSSAIGVSPAETVGV